MSGWTIITVRGKHAADYPYTHHDWEHDRTQATYDITATFEEDRRVRVWDTYSHDHAYALLNCERYDWEFAESLFEDYEDLIDDAVVLGWNDTTDSGCARYYSRPDLGQWAMQYEETDPRKGERACAVMHAQYGIYAQNPFHNPTGRRDGDHLSNGNVQGGCLDD